MFVNRFAAICICIALLSSCVSTATTPDISLIAALNDAEAAQKAGRNEQAIVILTRAANTYPTEKMPWLRLSQLHYETHNYGAAIVDANEVLARDADDTLAHSILAVSALRVANQALADLAQKNRIGGDPKNEAQELTKLLRTALGEDKLVPPSGKSK